MSCSMYIKDQNAISNITKLIDAGEIGILPTDTLYGFSCSALNVTSVEKIYAIKQRELNKPFIVLIHDINILKNFDITLTEQQQKFLNINWPNCLTVVLECSNRKFEYLHRGNNSIGFRLPNNEWLLNLLNKTGPLTSTTVNIAGEPAITDFAEAINKFENQIDFAVDAGTIKGNASTVIKLNSDGTYITLREGDAKIQI